MQVYCCWKMGQLVVHIDLDFGVVLVRAHKVFHDMLVTNSFANFDYSIASLLSQITTSYVPNYTMYLEKPKHLRNGGSICIHICRYPSISYRLHL
jgi:hypothetical protein